MKRLRSVRGVEFYQDSKGREIVFIRYQSGGRQYSERIGPSEMKKGRNVTAAKARRKLEARRREIATAKANGEVWESPKVKAERERAEPQEAQKQAEAARSNRVTFEEFAEGEFLKNYTGRRATGVRSDYYEQQIRRLNEYWGETALADIDELALDRYARHLSGERLSPGSIRKRLMALGTILKQAHRWGRIDRVPLIEKPPEASTPYRRLKAEEWGKLIETILDEPDARPWEAPLLRLALATASRRQEILGLRWTDIEDGNLHLRQGKTGSGKKVPLGAVAESVLLARKPFRFLSDFVFCDDGGNQLKGNWVGKVIRKRLAAAGIANNHDGKVAFHSLRSTAASWLADAHVGEPLIATLLGHSLNQTTTQRYIHLSTVPTDLVDLLDSLILRAEAVDQNRVPTPEIGTQDALADVHEMGK